MTRNQHIGSRMDQRSDSALETRLLRRLLRYVGPYTKYLLAAVALTVLNTPLMLASAPLTKAAVDLFIAPDASGQLPGYEVAILSVARRVGLAYSPGGGLLFIALLFLMAIVFSVVMQYAYSLLMQFVGQRVMHDLRIEAFRHLQSLPVRFHDRN